MLRTKIAVTALVMGASWAFMGFASTANAAYTGGTGGPSAPPSPSACVKIAAAPLSHTWDGQTVTVTLAGQKTLCAPLYVLVAKYAYDNPVASIWPQHLVGTSAVIVIKAPGVYSATAPKGCGQADAYAKRGSAPAVSPVLTGSGKPFEAQFVSDFSKGPVTNHADKHGTCVAKPSPSPTPTPSTTPSKPASHTPKPSLIPAAHTSKPELAHTGANPAAEAFTQNLKLVGGGIVALGLLLVLAAQLAGRKSRGTHL